MNAGSQHAGSSGQQWWLSKQGTSVGPYDAAFILDGLRTGKIPPDTFACLVGGKTWKRLCESATFAAACPKTTTPGSATAPGSLSVRLTKRRAIIIAGAGGASLAAVVVGSLFSRRGNADWIQAVSRSAGQSVVRIDNATGGLGTGFVVASRGNQHLVLTNRHVLTVEEGFVFTTQRVPPQCRVTLQSHEEFLGRVVGLASDPEIDLGLVLIEAPSLRPLRIRDFSTVAVGERVVAIGHPRGLEYSVTEGIVSAKRGDYFLQTSAAINPGNSGGPLFDEQGRVVAVNTLHGVDAQGLNFSIRADLVLQPQLWTIAPAIKDLMRRMNH